MFIAANLILGPHSSPTEPEVINEVVAAEGAVATEGVTALPPAAPETPEATKAPVPPPSNATVADSAATALAKAPGLDGTSLEVRVRAGAAVVTGEVLTHIQRAEAIEIMEGVPGVLSADLTSVTVLARTQGTEHVVVSGDNLSKIAYQYYGDAGLSRNILRANPNTLKGKANLKIGQRLVVPAIVE